MAESHSRREGLRTLRALFLAKLVAGIGLTLALGAGYWLRANGLSVGELANELRQGSAPRYEWQSIDRRHWQAASGSAGEAVELTDDREGTSAGCTPGMARVKGAFRRELHGRATGEVERLQDAACIDWISREFPARCRTFDREKIAAEVAKLPTEPMDYCIDRFEYPNVLGQNPMIVATFREAESVCKKGGKRLCTENEWTFACEGEEVRPYPYGYTRDGTACVIDRNWRPFAEGALQPRDGRVAREELDRLWQGEPSGSRGGCKSPFGVYDLTGNVDEWTRSVNPTGYSSVLKGGYWGPVRARCRPATRAHNEDFVAYQQSFRCCDDADATVPAPLPAPAFGAVVDAGAHLASTPASPSAADDAGARPTADLGDWTPSEGDEVVAITRARVALCEARGIGADAAGQAAPTRSTTGLGGALVFVAAMLVRRRGSS